MNEILAVVVICLFSELNTPQDIQNREVMNSDETDESQMEA